MRPSVTIFCLIIFLFSNVYPQNRVSKSLKLNIQPGLAIQSCQSGDGNQISFRERLPLFSFKVNNQLYASLIAQSQITKNGISFQFPFKISGQIRIEKKFSTGWKATILFINDDTAKQKIENLVPFGENPAHTYITGAGSYEWPHYLSRSVLFRPGEVPIGVILPDNAWELGFTDIKISEANSLVALARRTDSKDAEVRRWWTLLNPGGMVEYTFWVEAHQGGWRDGLRRIFQERWLYDLEKFDLHMYQRTDLQWIRSTYLMLLRFAWDHVYFDALAQQSNFKRDLAAGQKLLGGYDVFLLWPTWPRLGLDHRNQWDLYRDLPGGLKELNRQVKLAHETGTKFFISYNPWDESTRKADHLKGMADLIRQIDADGVVLDTRGESSRELQETADRVKPGIVMYSEGMAVPKHMPGIVAGRVHDALFMPPPLNLNKFIKPDFAIFRVLQLTEGRLHRELNVALFNGYGVELNVMRSGRPDWMDEELNYMGRIVKLLRENSSAFLSPNWQPLLPGLQDSIWINHWPTTTKTIYTIYSLKPEGFRGPLFEVPADPDFHYVSLWHHQEIDTTNWHGKSYIPAAVDGFNKFWLGTRQESNIDCIARLPKLLHVNLYQDSLTLSASKGKKILVWPGKPAYHKNFVAFPISEQTISLHQHFGRYEGDFVIQLFDSTELLDERVVTVKLATPRLISKVLKTIPAHTPPPDMVVVPAGEFNFVMRVSQEPNVVAPYPDYTRPRIIQIKKFYMDKYPVTNRQFKAFLDATGYQPADTVNFLHHWQNGKPILGQENHPVVNVSYEDAQAYCQWSGKRLPTDIEWQYAAQGHDGRKYPWGNEMDSTRCNYNLNSTTPVDAFPTGASPYGVMDLVGNVWQLTNDIYDNGSYYFSTMRGGSHYHPTASIWYVVGGPWPIDQHQILLKVAPGFDRNATVGFRCVKDAD